MYPDENLETSQYRPSMLKALPTEGDAPDEPSKTSGLPAVGAADK
jgi:hypothetical protein